MTVCYLDHQATTPNRVARDLQRALALLTCTHERPPQPEGARPRACRSCEIAAGPLVKPIGHALIAAANGGEYPDFFNMKPLRGSYCLSADDYARIGHGLEVLERAAGIYHVVVE